jgi:hypothetical protein
MKAFFGVGRGSHLELIHAAQVRKNPPNPQIRGFKR